MFPTLLTNVNDDMNVMKEEIFGSVLPLMTYTNLGDVLDYIRARPRPLALYVMSDNKKEVDRIITQSHSGGVCVNDTVIHVGADDAPFGGVGDSGMGHYHGREGFLTFSKAKTVVRSSSSLARSWYLMKYRDRLLGYAKSFLLK
jgi:coniferyl-aldehyde dehydrogenase